MALYAMPLVVLNMGAEMVYILEQRLHAQKISHDKRTKVLVDVVKTMYSDRFVTELFKPQKVYTNDQTRQIFDKLAHSSIMRLNASSMEKLYDLMSMGFKYQCMACVSPRDYIQLTCNHLEELEQIVNQPIVSVLIGKALQQTISLYSKMSMGELRDLKETLFRFFQDRNIKVSLFLQENLQKDDGSFVMGWTGHVAENCEIPGIVRYFSNDGSHVETTTMIKLANQIGTMAASRKDPLNRKERPCKLGKNVYAVPRSEAESATAEGAGAVAHHSEAKVPALTAAEIAEAKAVEDRKQEKIKNSHKAGLNMLATLMGSSVADTENGRDRSGPQVKMDFSVGDSSWMFQTEAVEVCSTVGQSITIDAKGSSKRTRDEYSSKLGLDDFGVDDSADGKVPDKVVATGHDSGSDESSGDDNGLLGMMDGAGFDSDSDGGK